MASETIGARPATRRRRDRRTQLAGVAAELFRRHGYHAVGIGDIAAAAGITGPAVYRHFTGKQDILAHVLLSGVDALDRTVARHLDPPGPPEQRLAALNQSFSRIAVERRDAVALWRWLGRHLDPEQRTEVRRRGEALNARWAAELKAMRDELSDLDADLLCRAAMGIFGSAANYSVTLGKVRQARLLQDLATVVLHTPLPRPDSGHPPEVMPPAVAGAAPRREVLLGQATRLFRERGYHEVTMEEIGAAAGIAGPSIYRHFGSKADLLRAAGNRMLDQLALDAARATNGATDPREGLDRLIVSYAGTVLAHRDLMAVYVAEMSTLPEEECAELRRRQRGYVAEWIRLIAATHPGRDPVEARVVAHAALTLANDLARPRRLMSRPGLESEIAELMRAVVNHPGGARPES